MRDMVAVDAVANLEYREAVPLREISPASSLS